jgi:anti-sigma B factor antagonist
MLAYAAAKRSESSGKRSGVTGRRELDETRAGNCIRVLSELFGPVGATKLQADLPHLRLLYVLLGFLLNEATREGRLCVFFVSLLQKKDLRLPGGANVALRMTDQEVNGVTVLEIEGRIVLGEESNAFREKVKSLLAAGKKKIVLNLANVGYIDSAGLGTLVATFHSARSQGATLKLANLGSKFKEVLQVTKLMTVFDTYDSEALAVQSFAK